MRSLALLALASLALAAPLVAVAPTAEAAGFCWSIDGEGCPGTVCMSTAPSTSVRENCNVMYVQHVGPAL